MNDVLFCGMANLNILSGDGLGESVLILSTRFRDEAIRTNTNWRYQPQLVTEQNILSLAREKVGQGKGAGDAGPREGTIAAEPISSCICSKVSSSLRLLIGRRGNSLTSIGRPLFFTLLPAFLSGRSFDLKFLNERMCHIFSQKRLIDCVYHVNHRL